MEKVGKPMKLSTDRRFVIPIEKTKLEELRSYGGGTRLEVSMTNQTGQEVRVFWRDTKGNEPAKFEFTLAANTTTTITTYARHAWVVRSTSGESLTAFTTVGSGTVKVDLVDEPEAPLADKLAVASSNTEHLKAFGYTLADSTTTKSESGADAFTLKVTNLSNRSAKVIWKDYDGNESATHSYDVFPGETLEVPTFLTHPWVVRDHASAVLGVITPVAATSGELTISGYKSTTIEGFTVHTNVRLLAFNRTKDATDLLTTRLKDLEGVLKAERVKDLQATPIWMGVTTGEDDRLAYHPSSNWLWNHQLTWDKEKSVEIPNIMNFINWTNQPMVILHELAHAYQDQFLEGGWSNCTQIKAAYDAAMNAGRYQQVYAKTNEREYFAEITEAYFGTNDHAPTNKTELETYDPAGYKLIGDIWDKGEFRSTP